MTWPDELERSYRRWLRLYPLSFRAEHGQEMLGVLLAGARPGQRRPGPVECLDLTRSAMAVRLRPRLAPSDHSTRLAVGLMWLGAVVQLAVALTIVATFAEVRASIVDQYPGYTSAQWHAELVGSLEPLAIAAGAGVALWLWLAWANGRARWWAKVLFALLFAEITYSLSHGVAGGSATYARVDLTVGIVLWLVALGAVGALGHGVLRRITASEPRGPSAQGNGPYRPRRRVYR
jgi:hypothetical protein